MREKRDKVVLISVYNKTGIEKIAGRFAASKYKIIATDGTAKYLKNHKIPVIGVDKISGFPEILEGRVKTLHPSIFGGILACDKSHLKEIKKFSIPLIDVVIINFYPFEEFYASNPNKDIPLDMIDIGGVAVLRAAAKNYTRVLAVSSPTQYDEVIRFLKDSKKGGFPLLLRKKFAALAFERTSRYDSFISSVLKSKSDRENMEDAFLSISLTKKMPLRYGENPHQIGVFCKADVSQIKPLDSISTINFRLSPSEFKSLGNKDISYNNLLDIDVGLSILSALSKNFKDKFGCAIIKHNNPCGVAISSKSLKEAYMDAISSDRISAFGGVVVLNEAVDSQCAGEILKIFTDCVAAPDFTDSAIKSLRSKKNLTIVKIDTQMRSGFEMRTCLGGVLIQDPDINLVSKNIKVVTLKKPSPSEMKALLFAYTVAKYCKSNAIVISSGARTLGIGAGTTSRIDAFHLALSKMLRPPLMDNFSKTKHHPIVLASDGFFPFDDIIREVAKSKCGISAIIQPGGSIRDNDSIKACDESGLSMVFTGLRHFRH